MPLARAIEREAREYRDRIPAPERDTRAVARPDSGDQPDVEPVDGVDPNVELDGDAAGELEDEDLDQRAA